LAGSLDDHDRQSRKAAVKFVVAQIGARRSYAVPAILEEAGMLERFYTDLTGDSSLAGLLPVLGKGAERLAARRLPSNIRPLTRTFPRLSLSRALRRKMRPLGPADSFRESVRFSNALGRAMVREGFGEATHLFSMLGECAPLLIAAKERGHTVVSEIYILLSTERILAEERKAFPGWEPDVPDYSAIRREMGLEDVLLTRSDFAICPSPAVRDDLVTNFGFDESRTAVVPYGMDPALLSIQNIPVRGRILFAGTAELRKGIHYLAMAAEKLHADGLNYEFRIVGNAQSSVANQNVCRQLTFLGRIPRTEMATEFASADLFVLPSLAEGSAEVTYEALAAGLPVVTTPEAGSVIRNGIDGQVVASRDPDALADAIRGVIEDPEKRARFANASRERAVEFTWKRYGERLVHSLKVLGGRGHSDSDGR
jgi:glycosyltransferase involved in cell wall biosynthesis